MRITKKMKKAIEEGKKLSNQYGYWSKEIYNYNSSIVTEFNSEQYHFIQEVIR